MLNHNSSSSKYFQFQSGSNPINASFGGLVAKLKRFRGRLILAIEIYFFLIDVEALLLPVGLVSTSVVSRLNIVA